MANASHTEKDMLLLLRNGDYAAFTTLYHRYKNQLARNLITILKDDALVEDTLQELFFRLWEKRDTINPEQSISGYLFRVASNLAHDHFRKLARDQRLAETFWHNYEAMLNTPETPYQKELDEALYQVIDQLPPQRKKVFMLCKFEAMSYQEGSDMLHISIPAVRHHIVEANKFLKANYPKSLPLLGAYFAIYLLKGLF